MKHYVEVLRCNHALDAVTRPNNSVSNSTLCQNVTLYSIVDPDSSGYSHIKECAMVQLPRPTSFQLVSQLDPSDPFNYVIDEIAIEIELSSSCSTCLYAHGGHCRLDSTQKFYCDQGMGPILHHDKRTYMVFEQ